MSAIHLTDLEPFINTIFTMKELKQSILTALDKEYQYETSQQLEKELSTIAFPVMTMPEQDEQKLCLENNIFLNIDMIDEDIISYILNQLFDHFRVELPEIKLQPTSFTNLQLLDIGIITKTKSVFFGILAVSSWGIGR